MSDLPGDKEFGEFINNGGEEETESSHECPRMFFIVSVIREKIKFINHLMKISTETYLKLTENDPLKEKFKVFLSELMENSNRSIDQLDFTLIEDDDPDE